MINRILPVVEAEINALPAAQHPSTNPVCLQVENDSHYTIYSCIQTINPGNALQQTYHAAFPRVAMIPIWQVQWTNLRHTSILMQQSQWPYCNGFPVCTRPNTYHCADIAVSYYESVNALPHTKQGERLFSIPLVLMEVEGSKDTWGPFEKESKAMCEVSAVTVLIPDGYMIYVYPTYLAIWHASRKPQKGCLDVNGELIHLSCGNRTLGDTLKYFFVKLIQIVVKQIMHNVRIANHSLMYICHHYQSKVVHSLQYTNPVCCQGCYSLQSTHSASGLRAAFPNLQISTE